MIRPRDCLWCFTGVGDDVPALLRGCLVSVSVIDALPGDRFRVGSRWCCGSWIVPAAQLSTSHAALEKAFRPRPAPMAPSRPKQSTPSLFAEAAS